MAAQLGKADGRAYSEAKAAAVRKNGKLGGLLGKVRAAEVT